MRVIARKPLLKFWEKNKDSEQPLKAWFQEAKKARWRNPNEIKVQYRNVSILRNSRVVFNIAGNKYRLVVRINYRIGIVYVRFIGPHTEYDRIDAENI